MSLYKAIEHGKEKRKPYRGAKTWWSQCRNHGRCSYCTRGRLHKSRALELSALEQISEDIDEQAA